MANRYLVLLRGINVGGRNKVQMAALRELLESHGHTKVSTYIASGNVILSSDRSAATIKRELEDALPKAFKLDSELIAVLVLTHAQLRAVVRDRPKGFGDQPDTYHSDAIFLMGIDAPTAMKVFDPRPDVDVVWPGKGVIYSQRLSAQRTKSRLGKIVGHPRLQVDDDPQLADDPGAARAHGGTRAVAAHFYWLPLISVGRHGIGLPDLRIDPARDTKYGLGADELVPSGGGNDDTSVSPAAVSSSDLWHAH